MAWFNAGLSSNSGGASSFNELDDVSINTQTLSNGQVPVYNSTTHKWENGEQSGGSSGHTIIDDRGTNLTQRDNLQFKGAYSEDNSTNGKTVVNVVRSMTKAQFDLLSANEKVGFINITDITGGNDDRFQPVIYSTEEREIGVWTDGKPLYEKTIVHLGTLPRVNDWALFDNSVSYGILISVEGVQDSGNTTSAAFSMLLESNPRFLIYQGGLYYYCSSNISSTALYFTIRYTKTTDQAGSGQWTPQGLPAVHYSEDEHIVGTWIDGSTLYEKTYHNSAITIASDTDLTIDDFSGKFPVSCNGVLHNSTDDRTYYPNYSYAGAEQANIYYKKVGNGNLVLSSERDSWGNTWEVFTTVRYTKSST